MESVNDVLRGIALRVYHGDHGGFMRTFADAYLLSDSENEKILRLAWMQLIDKYLLETHGA
ncbi:unnamed protein product, partial [marine sediment metagenome]